MANERLLLIDDDMHHLQILQKVFQNESYSVAMARNAAEAIAELEREIPDLIILDLILPDMDGYALLETIKTNPEWRFIPVVILSSKQNLEDKLRGLRLGVMDYVTKPFEREELVARVRNLLDFYKLKLQQQKSTGKNNHQRLIDFMKERGIKSLVPRVCRGAKLGFTYPEAALIFNPEETGGEIFMLESMAKARMLERVFHDAVHICPKCGHHDLNFREVCPHCDYADITQKRLITHLSCGYRGPEDEFKSEAELRCPKCTDALHRLGEDYEINGSAFHFCNGCQEEFSDPVVNCRCMNCDHQFDVSSALIRKVYAYRLISDWQEAILPDPPAVRIPGEMEEILEKIRASRLNYLGFTHFLRQLEDEIQKAGQEVEGISLIGVRFKCQNPNEVVEVYGLSIFWDAVLSIFKSILRNYDIITLKEPLEWLIMLPETPFRMANILAERLHLAMNRLEFDIDLEINMASFPEDGLHASELLEVLKLGLVKFQTSP